MAPFTGQATAIKGAQVQFRNAFAIMIQSARPRILVALTEQADSDGIIPPRMALRVAREVGAVVQSLFVDVRRRRAYDKRWDYAASDIPIPLEQSACAR